MSRPLDIESKTSRVLLADDHDLVRSGLKALLRDVPNLEIVGEAADGRAAVDLCRRLAPDLVLMDVRMPGMNGLEATREIKRRQPRVGVLILTVHEDQEYMLEAIRAGAAGYVLKDAPRSELVDAVRRALAGETTLDRDISARLLTRLAGEVGAGQVTVRGAVPDPASFALTRRELEVLRLLARGYNNQRIATDLVVSVGTVKNHVQRIISKLGVSDRTQAVVRAFEAGIARPQAR